MVADILSRRRVYLDWDGKYQNHPNRTTHIPQKPDPNILTTMAERPALIDYHNKTVSMIVDLKYDWPTLRRNLQEPDKVFRYLDRLYDDAHVLRDCLYEKYYYTSCQDVREEPFTEFRQKIVDVDREIRGLAGGQPASWSQGAAVGN